jgi:hypothetical protein
MQQPQRIWYSVFDQVEPTRSPWPRLFRPSTPSNARRRGRARVQKLLKGGLNADPFVIARASVENRTVVTMEKFWWSRGGRTPDLLIGAVRASS